MKSKVLILEAPERTTVEKAVREVCEVRGYRLYALNVRTNHAHLVVGNAGTPERMMDSFKAYATRALRGNGLLGAGEKAWSRHGSTRYLWTEEHLAAPVEYVVSGQGGEFRGFD